MSPLGARKCPFCRRVLTLVAGRFPDHTDRLEPCTGSGLTPDEAMDAARERAIVSLPSHRTR